MKDLYVVLATDDEGDFIMGGAVFDSELEAEGYLEGMLPHLQLKETRIAKLSFSD